MGLSLNELPITWCVFGKPPLSVKNPVVKCVGRMEVQCQSNRLPDLL